MLQNTMLKIVQHGGIDVELPLQVKVSLWVKEGGWLHPDCRLHAETMGGQVMHVMGAGHHRHCCRDPAMAPLLQLLARQGWGRMRTVGLKKKTEK